MVLVDHRLDPGCFARTSQVDISVCKHSSMEDLRIDIVSSVDGTRLDHGSRVQMVRADAVDDELCPLCNRVQVRLAKLDGKKL